MAKKIYNFMKTDPGSWQSPKYTEAVKKAVEVLESDKYKNVLEESDFWQLTGKTKTGKTAYNGLIISHNGCLKINDALEPEKRFRPECVKIDKDGYGGSLVFIYCCEEQGIFEVGEVSRGNCTNEYKYAMALKRCMDRVILKSSKLAYAGIFSDSEAEEFSKPEDAETKTETKPKEEPKKAEEPEEVYYTVELPAGAMENPRKALVDFCKAHKIDIMRIAKDYKLANDSKPEDFLNTLSELVVIYS